MFYQHRRWVMVFGGLSHHPRGEPAERPGAERKSNMRVVNPRRAPFPTIPDRQPALLPLL